MTSPRVKDLDQLSTIFNLVQGIVSNVIGQILKNGMEKFGLIECHFLDFQIFLGGLTLNEVGGQSVRTTDESKDGGFRSDLLAQDFESFGDEWSRLIRVHCVHLNDKQEAKI